MDEEKKEEVKKLFRVRIETFEQGLDEDADTLFYQVLENINMKDIVTLLNRGY